MQFRLSATEERIRLPWKVFPLLAICTAALLIAPLHGQDDDNAPPPPPDNGAAAPDQAGDASDDSASFQTFYDQLGSQGTWIQSSDYGYVWQPPVNDPDWAPYTDGYWVYTDDGWTWVSNEPWGWATYHYGRWVNLDGTGWCWVPGYTWAPAWVSWRYGDGYCGWAPLPPDSFVGVDYYGDGFALGLGFHIGGDCDGFYGIGAGWYSFLPVSCLGYRNYHGYYRHRSENYALINHTTNVTNLNITRSGAGTTGARGFTHVTTGGPMLAQVNAVSQMPVQRVSLVRTNQPGGGGTLTANSLALYAPHVNSGTTAQPARVSGFIREATINRGTDITQPLAVNSRLAPAYATESQIEQAHLAQSRAPASAKVVTDSSTVQPILRTPLTSLQPLNRPATTAGPVRTPGSTFDTQRSPGNSGFAPAPVVRTYSPPSEEGGQSRVYYPGPTYYSTQHSPYESHPAPTETGGGAVNHSFERPSTPVAPVAPSSHPSTGGGTGGGNYHSGSGSSQSH